MIANISGKISEVELSLITIDTPGGIGYAVNITKAYSEDLVVGKQIKIATFLRITDSSHTLFGFQNSAEKAFFKLLLTVSGVGPKSAMNILGLGGIDEIQSAIAREDVKYLTSVQGMGKKTAERLVVELKTKIAKLGISSSSGAEKFGDIVSDAIEALSSMGYSQDEAKEAVLSQDIKDKSVEVILKKALQQLAR